jgi:hypothetical protein
MEQRRCGNARGEHAASHRERNNLNTEQGKGTPGDADPDFWPAAA